jgi:pimeloyl-ACP methyl ester carboxylesterase
MSDGPTIVFVHGSGDSSRIWRQVISFLPEFNCVALDLPGHGAHIESPGPQSMSVADYALDVSTQLEQRALSGICLAGHSLGGAIALYMAVHFASLVGSLALIGTGARLRVAPQLLQMASSDPQRATGQLAEMGVASGDSGGAAEDYQREDRAPLAGPGILYRDLAACDAFDMMADLNRIHQPAIIITGEQDRMTPPKYALYLRDHLTNSTLAMIPNAGHFVPYEQPKAVANALANWLPQVG